jgi:hypothetical protein
MSTQKETSVASAETAKGEETKLHPAPSFVWLLIPVALLGLLAYLARG